MTDALLIDQGSVSFRPTDQDISTWAAGKRVFVSSLITDMPSERSAARNAIESIGAEPVMFEHDLGGQDVNAEQAYLTGVRSSMIYVGLWDSRYGVRMSDGYSATHAEFNEAERSGLRLCLFVRGDGSGDMDGSQRDLVQGARNLYTTGSWNSEEDLTRKVARRLTDLAAEDLAPWVRLGRLLFRANEISNDGSSIEVRATVLNRSVHAELVRLRDSRGAGLSFVGPDVAARVQMTKLSTRTVSTASREESMVLVVQGSLADGGMRATVNGVPPDEIAKSALSDGLFGTNTLESRSGGGLSLSFGNKPVDPLESIRSMSIDDAVLRPVVRLLVTEHLLRSGNAASVDTFALGPRRNGERRLRISWTPRPLYSSSADPEPVTIEGQIKGL